MSLDFTKIDNYKAFRLYTCNEDDGPVSTLEQVITEAQKCTDKSSDPYGVYKLIKYTEAAAPRATVLDVPV